MFVFLAVTAAHTSCANLFVGYIEHQFFNQYNSLNPELYHCYIDDCIGATSSPREGLNQYCCQFVSSSSQVHLGNFPIFLYSHFWISEFLTKTMVYAPVCIE